MEDGFPLKYFAKMAHCSRSTMTGVIDTMEKDGLVIREDNPIDGRSKLIKLTEKGKSLQFYKPPTNRDQVDFFRDFKPDEIVKLRELLKKLSDSLKQ